MRRVTVANSAMASVAVLLAACFLAACEGQYISPYVQYQARLKDFSTIKLVESRVRVIAQRRNLGIVEKNRKEMSAVTGDSPAFFIFLEHEGDTVLTISNAGAGALIRVMAFERAGYDRRMLDVLVEEVIGSLSELDLSFGRLGLEQ